jgi:hypothetical protein
VGEGVFADHMWAEPDLTHLIDLMQHVYHHRDEARLKGQQARRGMIARFTPRQLASDVLGLIEQHIHQTDGYT